MPLVKGDLAGFCLAGAKGELRSDLISFDDGWSVCVILASAGYPEARARAMLIRGLKKSGDFRVYHAGTRQSASGRLGNQRRARVLAVVSAVKPRMEAVTKAHAAADGICFPGLQRRRDIGILNFD